MVHQLYGQKTMRGHILSVMRCWLLHHVIVQLSICSLASESTRYVRYNDRSLICNSDLIPLTSSPANYLECARTCERQSNCTAFMFTRNSPGVQGTCSWCPANDIVNISYTPADPLLETWTKILGYLVFPNDPSIQEPIPSTLSVGRAVIFQARVPDPVTQRSFFSLCVDNKLEKIAVRVAARFNYHGDQERVIISNHKDWYWELAYSPEGFFPFSPGQKIEIAVLGRSEGFDVFLNGDYIRTVNRTATWVGQINYVEVADFEEVLITI
ncbi:beta-galactoside-binding lectin [Plakobranchus ocellatus]|uniref:Galectin n=1 Tax=Plakobranchus ocellatus TaxID=259542 RepID=A0AAV4CQ29_9GAST|nr:beta-galactoside-binding lectin [Plakobranchus ocellatus]